MKNKVLILSVFTCMFLSCEKSKINESEQIMADYNVDSMIEIILINDKNDDLLDQTNKNGVLLEDIVLKVSGNNTITNGKPPYFPYYTMNDFVSPVNTKYLIWSDKRKKNILNISLDYNFSDTKTIIEWNNGFSSDIITGEMKFDNKQMLVKCVKLYLNGKLVWDENSNSDRIVEIKK